VRIIDSVDHPADFINASISAAMDRVGGMQTLWNATLALSEKGFYAMAFALSLFAAIAVQKNIRDVAPVPGAIKEIERDIAA
jgi:hypothetical protein